MRTSSRRSCLNPSTKLGRDEYEVVEMIQETFLDLDQIVSFLEEAKKFEPRHDDKLKKLIRLLKSKELENQKVLIFTEFADTARYLLQQLTEAGIEGVAQVDSATKGNRADILQRFSPYYNGTNSRHAASAGQGRDSRPHLHRCAVRRSEPPGRQPDDQLRHPLEPGPPDAADRPCGPAHEPDDRGGACSEITPRSHASRGKVSFWNFLPPDELNALLTLYTKVTQKTLLISKTLGIEGKKLLTPEDDYEALKEFNHAYEGTKTAVEEMHLEYQALLQDHPELADRLNGLPGAFFSGRKRPAKGTRGVFFCYALPALDKETGEFTEEAGTTRWYLYDMDKNTILEEPGEIIESLRCKPDTPRRCITEREDCSRISGPACSSTLRTRT